MLRSKASPLTSNGSTVFSTATTSLGIEVAAFGSPAISSPLGGVAGINQAARVASSGAGYLAAWSTSPGVGATPGYTVWARRLALDGTPLGSPELLASFPPGAFGGAAPAPSVVWTGNEYAVLWLGQGAVSPSYVRVGKDGTIVDTTPVVADTNNGYGPPYTYAGGDGQIFVISSGNYPCVWALSPSDGEVDFEVILSQLSIPNGAAAAWIDATHLQIAFVGANALYGSVVDLNAMHASTAVVVDSTAGLVEPVAARGASETLVGAVTPAGAMIAYRLDATGAVLDGPYTGATTMAGGSGPALTWDGARYVLTWGAAGDGGTHGYASDLGTLAAPFLAAGTLQPFAEAIAGPGPGVATLGDGGALLVATRALPSDTSVVSVSWTSAAPLPPVVVDGGPEGGLDGGYDAGGYDAGEYDAGEAGPTDAGNDDAGAPGDAGSPITGGGEEDAGSASDAGPGATDAAPPSSAPDAATSEATDAGAAGDDDGGAAGGAGGVSGASGCSCRAGAGGDGGEGAGVFGLLLALGALGRRRRARGGLADASPGAWRSPTRRCRVGAARRPA